ncbi:MAG TPA: dihydroxyacetone kinase subunit DhaL [Terrimicrobiaceae bacterium]
MEQKPLDLLETRDALVAALTTLSSNGDYLNQLDQALGDGDHGSTIARGSDAAIRDLQGRTFATVNQEFEAIGSAMMKSMGGASGILFGVLFRAAKNCPATETLDASALAGFLRRGLDDLKRKSPAAVGDKTMMDALVPAVETLEAKQTESLASALRSSADAAKKGAESTMGMLARFGRATALGERVRAAQDPGATSIFLFLNSLAAATEKSGN